MEKCPHYPLEGTPYYKKGHHWVPQLNYDPAVISGMPKKVMIHDVTLRDGEQTPGVTFTEDERVRIGECLIDIGVGRIEAGMPAVSAVQNNALKRICKLPNKKSQIYGFARALEKDIQLVIDAGCSGIVIEHTVNPYLCDIAYKLTPQMVVDRLVKGIKTAKKYGLKTTFMGWDWLRAPMDWTKWLMTEILSQTELDGLTMVDTYGSVVPEGIEYLFKNVKEWFPSLSLEFHGHNDFNLGNACSLAALRGGADCIHTAMNGLGERVGNVATEEVVMTCEILQGMDTGIELDKLYDNAQVISTISKLPIYSNKCILGDRAFQVESGITTHYVGMIEDFGITPPAAPFVPSVIGRPGDIEYVLGKNSGKGSIEIYLKKNSLTATDEQLEALVNAVKAEGLVTKALVPEAQFLKIYKKICG